MLNVFVLKYYFPHKDMPFTALLQTFTPDFSRFAHFPMTVDGSVP